MTKDREPFSIQDLLNAPTEARPSFDEPVKVDPDFTMADLAMAGVEKAEILIESVQAALDGGVRHFDKSGRELTSAKEVLQCLKDEGEVQLLQEDDQ